MPTERITFTGHSGDELAARLDLPRADASPELSARHLAARA